MLHTIRVNAGTKDEPPEASLEHQTPDPQPVSRPGRGLGTPAATSSEQLDGVLGTTSDAHGSTGIDPGIKVHPHILAGTLCVHSGVYTYHDVPGYATFSGDSSAST